MTRWPPALVAAAAASAALAQDLQRDMTLMVSFGASCLGYEQAMDRAARALDRPEIRRDPETLAEILGMIMSNQDQVPKAAVLAAAARAEAGFLPHAMAVLSLPEGRRAGDLAAPLYQGMSDCQELDRMIRILALDRTD